MSSVSYDNYSMVILEYEQSANMDSILIEIQQKLDQLEGSFFRQRRKADDYADRPGYDAGHGGVGGRGRHG